MKHFKKGKGKEKKKNSPIQNSPNNLKGKDFYLGIQLVLFFLSYVTYIFQVFILKMLSNLGIHNIHIDFHLFNS